MDTKLNRGAPDASGARQVPAGQSRGRAGFARLQRGVRHWARRHPGLSSALRLVLGAAVIVFAIAMQARYARQAGLAQFLTTGAPP